MEPKYKIEIDGDGELYVARIEDNKVMATIVDGEIQPTAPSYHKHKEEFAALLAEHVKASEAEQSSNEQEAESEAEEETEQDTPEDEEPEESPASITDFPPVDPALAGLKGINGEPVPSTPPDDCDKLLGDTCPKFIAWLFVKDRAEADKRYAGKNLPTYETLIAADHE